MSVLLYILAAVGGAAVAVVTYRATRAYLAARRRRYEHARQDLIQEAVDRSLVTIIEKRTVFGERAFLGQRDRREIDTRIDNVASEILGLDRRVSAIEPALQTLNRIIEANDKKKGKK